MLANYVLNPEESYGFEWMINSLFELEIKEFKEEFGKAEEGSIEIEKMAEFLCRRAVLLYNTKSILEEKLEKERLKTVYNVDYFKETGPLYRIKVQILNDIVTLQVDTSGEALHKRGYRVYNNEAPIKETLAAALIYLTKWKGEDYPLIDPTCGTGTLAIEAAMIAKNMAPGVNRRFSSEKWSIIPANYWVEVRDEAFTKETDGSGINIFASDIDGEVISIAKQNAENAGVEDLITFEQKHLVEIYNYTKSPYGIIISNPPYGDRLEDKEKVEKIYRLLGDVCRKFKDWSYYVITSYEDFQTQFEMKATKNRKLYNGGIKTYYYQYFGRKPRINRGE
jgi:putative N6-adenine-specific DNA methylase